MPFEIVRNDIVNMQVDAVVNTANPNPVIGSGVDSGIHKKAGSKLLMARKNIGCIAFGDAVITPGFGLDAKYIIHTVGPIWENGNQGEEQLLSLCYRKSLALAKEYECESIAFPLIATGNYGVPKALALKIAICEISSFLLENEIQIYLVIFGKEALALSEKMFKSISSFIDENYISSKTFDEYGWEFLFLGANIDAAAKRFGIYESMAANYHCDEVGTALNYEVISEVITSVRGSAALLSSDWKKKMNRDYKKRGGKR